MVVDRVSVSLLVHYHHYPVPRSIKMQPWTASMDTSTIPARKLPPPSPTLFHTLSSLPALGSNSYKTPGTYSDSHKFVSQPNVPLRPPDRAPDLPSQRTPPTHSYNHSTFRAGQCTITNLPLVLNALRITRNRDRGPSPSRASIPSSWARSSNRFESRPLAFLVKGSETLSWIQLCPPLRKERGYGRPGCPRVGRDRLQNHSNHHPACGRPGHPHRCQPPHRWSPPATTCTRIATALSTIHAAPPTLGFHPIHLAPADSNRLSKWVAWLLGYLPNGDLYSVL